MRQYECESCNVYSASLLCCSIREQLAKHCSRDFRNRRQKPTLAIAQLGFGGHTVNWSEHARAASGISFGSESAAGVLCFTKQPIWWLLVVSCSIEFVFGCVRALREAYKVQLYCMLLPTRLHVCQFVYDSREQCSVHEYEYIVRVCMCTILACVVEVSTGPKFPARPANFFSARPGPAAINILQNL